MNDKNAFQSTANLLPFSLTTVMRAVNAVDPANHGLPDDLPSCAYCEKLSKRQMMAAAVASFSIDDQETVTETVIR
jgi:hypothetical protein